jgi:hypothetical protein
MGEASTILEAYSKLSQNFSSVHRKTGCRAVRSFDLVEQQDSTAERWEVPMTKGEILAKYKDLSPQEQHTFNQWLIANAVIGSIFCTALVAIALTGSQLPGPTTPQAPTRAQTTSFLEQHGLAHLENLPVDQINNQALVFTMTEPEPQSAMISDRMRR